MSQPIHVEHGAVVNLAQEMDECSHQACDILSRYEAAVNDAHSSQAFVGQAGSTNIVTTAEIVDAQNKIQQRFKAVNDLLRQAGATYAGAEEDNNSSIAQVAGFIKFQ